jgi:hypothetical protein
MQRTISGYHLLTMMSVIDNTHEAGDEIRLRQWLIKEIPESITEQDRLIRDWLTHQFVALNLDPEMDKLTQLLPDHYSSHFHWHIDNFYKHSTAEERMQLLKFAMEMITLDGKVTKEENHYFDMLYNAWADGGEI